MSINWVEEIQNLDLEEMTEELRKGDTAIMGVDFPAGTLQDKPFEMASSTCSKQYWFVDNTDLYYDLWYGFLHGVQSVFILNFFHKTIVDEQNNPLLIRTIGPLPVKGRIVDNGNPIMLHGLLGDRLFVRIGQWAQNLIQTQQQE